MKKLITIIILTFITKSYSQTQDATIHFNDGTSVFGYGEIKDDWKIKFRTSQDIDADIWTDKMVYGITFHGFEEDVEYRYMYKKEDQRYPLLLEVLTEGEVTLYADTFSSKIFIPFVSGNVFSLSTIQIPTTTKLYVNRRSDFIISSLNGGFKRKIRAYFADCPMLLEKVNNNEFGRPQIIELVNYYNDFCTDWNED
jgi:hypothetical protein|nr:hypothetical protein [uncultured Psychroserpens sp.]